jgi:hypothetical protein
MNETETAANGATAQQQGPDLSESKFPPVTRDLEEQAHAYFNDPNYYKEALSGEGDIAQRVHNILQKYMAAKDPKDRSVFRQQIISPYWDLLGGMAHGFLDGGVIQTKHGDHP